MPRPMGGPSVEIDPHLEELVPDGEGAFDDHASENPRTMVPFPRHEEDVTFVCFNAPNEATPLNP